MPLDSKSVPTDAHIHLPAKKSNMDRRGLLILSCTAGNFLSSKRGRNMTFICQMFNCLAYMLQGCFACLRQAFKHSEPTFRSRYFPENVKFSRWRPYYVTTNSDAISVFFFLSERLYHRQFLPSPVFTLKL